VQTTCFSNKLHQVRSKVKKIGEPNNVKELGS